MGTHFAFQDHKSTRNEAGHKICHMTQYRMTIHWKGKDGKIKQREVTNKPIEDRESLIIMFTLFTHSSFTDGVKVFKWEIETIEQNDKKENT
jgi:hypothetical protein